MISWSGTISEIKSQIELLHVVTATSLLLLIFWGFEHPLAKITVQLGLLAVLLHPPILRTAWLWVPLAITNTIALLDVWVSADNHKYLTLYWIFVVALAVSMSNNEACLKILSWHARFFLAFVFCMAALQKTFSPTYMSGEMFELRLLLDTRFTAFGHLFGLDKEVPAAAQIMVEQLKNPQAQYEDNSVFVPSTDWARKLSLAITWYDLLIQYAIGLLFIPGRTITDRLGHYALLFFIFTTYLPAPVYGFGWLLTIYGTCVTWTRFPRLRLAYATAFVAVLFYQLPWREWVLEW